MLTLPIEVWICLLYTSGDRRTISWVENVMTLEHQDLSLHNSLIAQWKVNSHLVTIEVGVEPVSYTHLDVNDDDTLDVDDDDFAEFAEEEAVGVIDTDAESVDEE